MLPEEKRAQLDTILSQMDAKGASKEDIQWTVNDFLSKYDVPTATEAATTAATKATPILPSKAFSVASGLGESVIGGIQGLATLPSIAKGLVTEPISTMGQIVSGPVTALTERKEEIKQDPYKGMGRLVGDIGQAALGFGVGRAGKALGAADVAPAAGVIPGAAPMAIESGAKALPMMSRVIAKTPLGAGPAAKAVKARSVAVTSEAERLLGGGATTGEQAGTKVVGALHKARQASEAAENALWNPLKAQASQRMVRAPLTNTLKNVEQDYLTSLEAHGVITSNLSPPTQRVLAQLYKGKEEDLLDLIPSPEEIRAQLPKSSMGRPTEEFLATLPKSVREKVLAEYSRQVGPPATTTVSAPSIAETAPPSWAAVHQARSEIGKLLKGAKTKEPLGSYDETALSKIYAGLTQDMRVAFKGHPDLSKAFEDANAFTKAQKELYWPKEKNMLVKSYMAASPSAVPSQMISKLLSGTTESAANFVKALGDNPVAHQELARGVISNILQKSSGRKFGNVEALTDGPKFEAEYLRRRPVLEKLIGPDLLSSWDSFAKEVGKYELTRGGAGTKEGMFGRIGSLAEAGAVGGAITSLAMGSPMTAAGLAAPLLVGRTLVNVMLQPEGPGLLARYFRTGKWTPLLGRIAEGGAYANVALGTLLAPPPSTGKTRMPTK